VVQKLVEGSRGAWTRSDGSLMSPSGLGHGSDVRRSVPGARTRADESSTWPSGHRGGLDVRRWVPRELNALGWFVDESFGTRARAGWSQKVLWRLRCVLTARRSILRGREECRRFADSFRGGLMWTRLQLCGSSESRGRSMVLGRLPSGLEGRSDFCLRVPRNPKTN
jgi:hypothetical protein